MNYNSLLDKLKKFSKIIVTGPQRSGTTYMTYILAKDLNYKKIDEIVYREKFTPTTKLFIKELNKENIVIQAPTQTHILHKLKYDSKMIIIFIHRDDNDIIKSEDRIGWHKKCFKTEELPKYLKLCESDFNEYREKFLSFKRNSHLKKFVWNNLQKPIMKNTFVEVEYDILEQTKEFIPKSKRINFDSKQIK
ncbi:hypothetical protein CMI47_17695 [Candidatus Pacearchaeota archaeon]|nr:hypothetical protein [Candidatus Pacearchaeota archaeon]